MQEVCPPNHLTNLTQLVSPPFFWLHPAEKRAERVKRIRVDADPPTPSGSTDPLEYAPDTDDEQDENLDAAFISDGESEDELSRPKKRGNANPVEPQTMTANFAHSNSTDHNMNFDQQGDFIATDFPPGCDYRHLSLKADHTSRPLYICPNMTTRTIILEAFHPLASQAQDFLITIAEPVSRPSHIHEYKLTKHSLQAAISVGLQTEDIIDVLNRLSKVRVSAQLAEFIRESTASYGKVKLVLKKNSYHVESSDPEVLRRLLRDSVISQARLTPEEGTAAASSKEGAMVTFGFNQDSAPKKGNLVIPGTKPTNTTNTAADTAAAVPKNADDDLFGAIIGVDNGQLKSFESIALPLKLTSTASR
jgi:DNA excision repair protein ERCC-3